MDKGDLIRRAITQDRLNRGENKPQWAERAGISYGTVAKWYREGSTPSGGMISRVMNALEPTLRVELQDNIRKLEMDNSTLGTSDFSPKRTPVATLMSPIPVDKMKFWRPGIDVPSEFIEDLKLTAREVEVPDKNHMPITTETQLLVIELLPRKRHSRLSLINWNGDILIGYFFRKGDRAAVRLESGEQKLLDLDQVPWVYPIAKIEQIIGLATDGDIDWEGP